MRLLFVWLSPGFCSLFLFAGSSFAEDLYLTDGSEMPGKLWLSSSGNPVRPIHARMGRPDPAYPNAIMKLQQVAVSPDNKIFFCSGLDGSVMHLLDGRHEIQTFEFDGQVRDLACTGEDATVYFSVVPTPQNGAPLADGHIYRRNFGEGRPTVVATVRQSDVGKNWWGTFTIRNGEIFIATLEDNSRVYRVAGDRATLAFETRGLRISGLSAAADGTFYVVNGDGKVYRTSDFTSLEPVLSTPRRLTDVAVRTASGSPRP
jgi:hypothetical protein